jgi:hypothetical protein
MLTCGLCHQPAEELSEDGLCLHCCERISSIDDESSPAISGELKTSDGPEEFDSLDPVGEEGSHVD